MDRVPSFKLGGSRLAVAGPGLLMLFAGPDRLSIGGAGLLGGVLRPHKFEWKK